MCHMYSSSPLIFHFLCIKHLILLERSSNRGRYSPFLCYARPVPHSPRHTVLDATAHPDNRILAHHHLSPVIYPPCTIGIFENSRGGPLPPIYDSLPTFTLLCISQKKKRPLILPLLPRRRARAAPAVLRGVIHVAVVTLCFLYLYTPLSVPPHAALP